MPAAADHSHWSAAVGMFAYPPSDRKRSRAWRASASSRSSASGGATSSSVAGSVTSGATQRSSAQRPHCAASLPYAQRRSDRLSPPAAFRAAAVRAAEPALSRLRAAAARWWPRWSACGGRPPRALHASCVWQVDATNTAPTRHGLRAALSGAQRVAARCPCLRCHRNEANYGCTRTTCARYGSTLRLCYHRRHAVFGHERAGERGHQRGGDAALAERQLGGWQRVHHMRCVPTTAANPPSPPAPPLSLPPSPPPPPAPPSPPAPPQLRLCGGPRIRLLGGETNVAILYVNEAYIYRLCTPPHMRNDAYAYAYAYASHV